MLLLGSALTRPQTRCGGGFCQRDCGGLFFSSAGGIGRAAAPKVSQGGRERRDNLRRSARVVVLRPSLRASQGQHALLRPLLNFRVPLACANASFTTSPLELLNSSLRSALGPPKIHPSFFI